ncbi:MAG TPA: hypothetical protein VFR94_23345 [Nitrososphaeraceae archaeon]|nr:hypothetical protein [Nitrososphaeraceae archaeon]
MKSKYNFLVIGRDVSNDLYLKSLVFLIFTIVMVSLAIASITNNPLAYSTSTINSTAITTNAFLDNIETKKVRVGDLDIAYKIFGKPPYPSFFNDNGYVGS